MNANKALWEKGDFTRLAETMRESGSVLVAKLGIKPGMHVLDLGCGDGTTAFPAARLGAQVEGVDIASNLVAAGNARVKGEGLKNITFREGDAIHLDDIPDASFDLVLSVFGAMFAPQPHQVAKEMFRVTRPGGKIVMGNWIPGDPTLVAQIFRINMAYSPPPPEGFVSPMLWGVESEVVDRFVKAGADRANISFSREPFIFKAPYPPATFLETFKKYFGPTMNAFEFAKSTGREEALYSELRALFENFNQSNNGGTTEIQATFLHVTVLK